MLKPIPATFFVCMLRHFCRNLRNIPILCGDLRRNLWICNLHSWERRKVFRISPRVVGGDSWSRGREFESLDHLLNEYCFTWTNREIKTTRRRTRLQIIPRSDPPSTVIEQSKTSIIRKEKTKRNSLWAESVSRSGDSLEAIKWSAKINRRLLQPFFSLATPPALGSQIIFSVQFINSLG